jgi:hypothetical protein
MLPVKNKRTVSPMACSATHPKIRCFKRNDVLRLVITDEPEADSVEIITSVKAELTNGGGLIGI